MSMIFPAPDPDEIITKLGPLVQEKVIIGERTFLISRPEHSDRLLDQPSVTQANEVDEYIPYWADLWPAARMLAKVILQEPWIAGTPALEIGCGLGLPGIAALARGLQVTFSDYDGCALRFAADNARLNGYSNFRVLQMDWRNPPDGLHARVILGSDLVYEMRNIEPVVAFAKKVLAPGGICLLTDQDRVPAQAFKKCLDEERMKYSTHVLRVGEPGGRRLKGTLYRITG
jgi:predicted nicotinamide N-methyase